MQNLFENYAIIVANGLEPNIDLFNFYKLNASIIIAADGGTNFFDKINLKPDIVIGDMDSYICGKNYEHNIIKIPTQNNTDLEKSINYLENLEYKNIIIFGATGLRNDHFLYNLIVLYKYHHLNLILIDNYSELRIIKAGKNLVYGWPGRDIAIFPLCEIFKKICTKNLKYESNGVDMNLNNWIFSSNEMTNDECEINFDEGIGILVLGVDNGK